MIIVSAGCLGVVDAVQMVLVSATIMSLWPQETSIPFAGELKIETGEPSTQDQSIEPSSALVDCCAVFRLVNSCFFGLGVLACRFLPWMSVYIFNWGMLLSTSVSYPILYYLVLPRTRSRDYAQIELEDKESGREDI